MEIALRRTFFLVFGFSTIKCKIVYEKLKISTSEQLSNEHKKI